MSNLPFHNNIQLTGRAGDDPSIKYFESGKVLCEFTIAVNRRKKDDPPDWFNLSIWGKTAEIAIQYVKKGTLVGVTGCFEIDSWEDRNTGVDRSKPFVNVDTLDLLSPKRDNENSPQGHTGEF